MIKLVKAGERRGLRPSPRFIQIVEKFFQDYRETIKKHNKGERLLWRVEREAKSESQNWSEFSHYYKEWLMRTNPDLTTDPMGEVGEGGSE